MNDSEAEKLLDEAASLIMAIDTVESGRVVIPEGWFDQTNNLLSRIRGLRCP